jgi:hypothetical protein
MADPLPVIPLEYAPADTSARKFRMALRVCQALAIAVCAVAFTLLFVDVESVLVTGPLIFVLGAALVVMGGKVRDWARFGIGAAHVGVCVLFVFLVNLLHWSPGDADVPFKWMGGFYLAGATGANVGLLLRERKTRSALD